MTTTTAPAASTSTTTQRRFDPLVGATAMMGVFTQVWMSSAANLPGAWSLFGWVGLVLGASLILATAALAVRARKHPAPVSPAGEAKRQGRGWLLAVVVEVIAIAIAVPVVVRYNWQLNLPVIALIVALHFILIYRTFGGRLHLATSAFGTLVGLAGIVAILVGAPFLTVWGLVGLGMGAITSLYGLLFASIIVRR